MNNDSFDAIITVVVLLLCLAAVFVPLTCFMIYVFFQSNKRKKIRERMLGNNRELVGNRQWFPARYASKSRYDSWWKIFPWEGAGIMILAPGSVLFLGETNSGLPINVQFAPSNSRLEWIGKSPFPNGAVSWFVFTMADRKDYFSSETGPFVFGSHRSTKQLYDEAARSFSGAQVV